MKTAERNSTHSILAGRCVLELGAGVGVVGIAAVRTRPLRPCARGLSDCGQSACSVRLHRQRASIPNFRPFRPFPTAAPPSACIYRTGRRQTADSCCPSTNCPANTAHFHVQVLGYKYSESPCLGIKRRKARPLWDNRHCELPGPTWSRVEPVGGSAGARECLQQGESLTLGVIARLRSERGAWCSPSASPRLQRSTRAASASGIVRACARVCVHVCGERERGRVSAPLGMTVPRKGACLPYLRANVEANAALWASSESEGCTAAGPAVGAPPAPTSRLLPVVNTTAA